MTFIESFNTCFRKKYITFSGRASRSEFWWFGLATWLIYIAFGVVAGTVFAMGGGFDDGFSNGWSAGMVVLGILGVIVFVGLLIPGVSVGVRRFHDRDMSGWWYLGVMIGGNIPFIGVAVSIAFLVIMVLKGTDGPNRFGPDPLKGGDVDIFA